MWSCESCVRTYHAQRAAAAARAAEAAAAAVPWPQDPNRVDAFPTNGVAIPIDCMHFRLLSYALPAAGAVQATFYPIADDTHEELVLPSNPNEP